VLNFLVDLLVGDWLPTPISTKSHCWTSITKDLAALDELLQSPNRELHPRKEDVIQVLQIGLIVSLIGLSLAFLGSEVTVIAVLSKSLALPQGVAVYRPENVIRSLDLFVILANVNLIGAHFVGGATPLGLLNWLDQ